MSTTTPTTTRDSWLVLWARRYAALIRSAWLVDLQYRANIALWLMWGIAEPAIALGLWWSIAESAGGSIEGYSQFAFARYFFAITLVNQLTQAWDAWYIDHWIAEGEMNHRLARPVGPIHESIADNIAYKARTGVIVILVWVIAAMIWPSVRITDSPQRMLLAALSIVLAAAIRFLNGFAIGLLAFWTTRATSLIELQMALGLFLSGQLAPLELLPARVSMIAHFLWFPYTIAFPVSLLTGVGDPEMSIAQGFAGQIVWLGIWWLAYRVVWRRGLLRYGAVGG